jgi:hypothetical protein
MNEPRGSPALRAGAGLFGGFALLAVIDAIAIAILVPAGAGGASLRIAHHVFDAAETLALGGAVAIVGAAAARLPRHERAIPLVYLVVGAPLVYLAIGADLRRAAALTANRALEPTVFALDLAASAVALPVLHWAATWCSRTPRPRRGGLGLAVAVMVGDHLVLADDYAGMHAVVAFGAAVFAGTVLGPAAEHLVRRVAASGRGRVALGALAGFALLGAAWPPSNAVRCSLFRPAVALAPWVLASTVWRSPSTHAHVDVPPSPWLRDRSADPPVAPTAPPLLPADAVVVLVGIDAVRADVVDDAANDALLPTLAALKRIGVVFRHASAPGTQTAVSLATLFSDRTFSELHWTEHGSGRTRYDYPADDPSVRFPELLTAHGVETASFDGLVFLQDAFGVARGFHDEHVLVTGAMHGRAKDLVDSLLATLTRSPDGPLFLYTHLMEPHEPYDRGRRTGTPRERYLSEIAVADHQLGRVVHELRRSFGDRWLLAVMSDHGEAFGEHGTVEHAKTLYEELLHVPLLVAGPRVHPRVVEERVGLVDVGPTILDLFGVPVPATFEGQSLVPLLAGGEAQLSRPLVAEGRLRRALTEPDGLKVIDDPRRTTVEAYDLVADPGETRNLFDVDPARVDPALATLRAFFEVHTLRLPGYRPPYKP